MARARHADPPETGTPSEQTPAPLDGPAPAEDAVPAPGSAASAQPDLIPGWLALVVLLLLLAIAALGGYLIRGMLSATEQVTPASIAVDDLEQKVAKDPDDPESLLALGYAYQQEGRYDEALRTYEEVLARDGRDTGALYNKGMLLMELGQAKEAEVVLWDVLEIAPDHALAAKSLGEYYIGKKQYKSALATLEPVVTARPEYADLQYLAGYACEQLGRSESAVAYYRSALTYNPDHREAREGLARLGASVQP